MGGGKSGSTGTQSSNQSSTVSIPPEVLARYNDVNNQAQGVAQTPFQSYTGEFVAPINGQQQYGINQITGAGNWINPTYANTVNTISAGLASAQPQYNAASGNITAGLAGGQAANSTALNQYGQALGAAQPYNSAAGGLYGGATGLALAGTGAVNPSAVDANAIGNYMSPYNQAVVNSTMALLNQQQAQQRNALTTQQILGGSFGGDRSGIDQAVLAGQQNLATGNVVSGLENQNYAQALAAAQQQQGVGLGAAQANRAALQQGAGALTGLGQATAGLGQQVYGQGTGQAAFTGQIGQQGYQQALGAAGAQQGLGAAEFGTLNAAAQGYGAAGGQALQSQLAQGQAALGAGTVEQQTQQAQDTALYNQFLQQQAYPFQTTQFLANIAEGTGALSGSTTNAATNQYTPQPFFSDRRLKENIRTVGHAKNGIPIVCFNYKGDPHRRIGMIAQDVEKKRPEAVGLAGGYKTVDYERATKARGGLAGGGPAPVIYEFGGAVGREDAGRGFADGGSPTAFDPATMQAILAAQQAMYPGAAGRPGMAGEGPRGIQTPQASGRQLMKAELMKMPAQAQQTTGLQEGLKDVSALAGAAKDTKSLYKMGKEAYDASGLGAASTNTPGALTPDDVDSSGKYVDTLPPPPVDPTSTLPDGTVITDAIPSARGGRQGRDIGGFIIPTLQDIKDVSGEQITKGLSGPTRPQPGLGAPMAANTNIPLTSTSAPAPPAPTASAPAIAAAAPAFSDGSANGATGSGGDAAGGVSGTGGVGGSASDGAGGSAAAGVGGDDGGTYYRGGTIKRALRYAAGGTPYDDDGYVPAADDQPIDPATLEKEQQSMEAKLPPLPQQKSGLSGGDSTMGDIGAAVGIAAKVLPFFLAGGGRTGRATGGAEVGNGLEQARHAIGTIESTNNYSALGPHTGGDRPYGRYQVMGANIPSWTKAVTGVAMTPQQFLHEPAVQDRVFDHFFGGAWRQFGNPEDAAAVWFSGKPLKNNHAADVTGTTVPAYINRFKSIMGGKDIGPPPSSGGTDVIQHAQRLAAALPGTRKLATAPPSDGGDAVDTTDPGELDVDYTTNKRRKRVDDSGNILPFPSALGGARRGYQDGGDPAEALAAADAKRRSDEYTPPPPEPAPTPPAKPKGLAPEPQGADKAFEPPPGWTPPQPGGGTQTPAVPTTPPPAPPISTPPVTGGLGTAQTSTQPDFFSRVGKGLGDATDWVDKHQGIMVPALSFLGSMLSSPSRTLAGSIGSGLVGGARAWEGQQGISQHGQEIGQGQQRIEQGNVNLLLNANAQDMKMLADYQKLYGYQPPGSPGQATYGSLIQALRTRINSRSDQLTRMGLKLPGDPGSAAPGSPPAPAPGSTPAPGQTPPGPQTPPAPLQTPPSQTPPVPQTPTPPKPPTPEPPKPPQQKTAEDPYDPTSWAPIHTVNTAGADIDPRWTLEAAQAQLVAAKNSGEAGPIANAENHLREVRAAYQAGQLPNKAGNGFTQVPGLQDRARDMTNVANNAKTVANEAEQSKAYPGLKAQIQYLKEVLEKYPTGAGAEELKKIAAGAQTVGLNMGDATSPEQFIKNSVGVLLNNPALRGAATDNLRDLVGHMTPNVTLQPSTNRAIIAELEAANDVEQKRRTDFANIYNGKNGGPSATHVPYARWQEQWQARPENQIIPRKEEIYKNTPARDDVPKSLSNDDWKVGHQIILTPAQAKKLLVGEPKKMPDGSTGRMTEEDIDAKFGGKSTITFIKRPNGTIGPVTK